MEPSRALGGNPLVGVDNEDVVDILVGMGVALTIDSVSTLVASD
jgi:hypothetical protein